MPLSYDNEKLAAVRVSLLSTRFANLPYELRYRLCDPIEKISKCSDDREKSTIVGRLSRMKKELEQCPLTIDFFRVYLSLADCRFLCKLMVFPT